MYLVIWCSVNDSYLSRLSIGAVPFISPLGWVKDPARSIHFSSTEEAQATIDFIVNVLDQDLEGDLQILQQLV